VIKAEHDLPGTEGGSGERVGEGAGGEMTQIMYAHVNKKKVLKISTVIWGLTHIIHKKPMR
jgi:hypothetical protein